MEDRYLNFYHYVMECIDDEDLPPDNEVCMCEDLCKTKDLARASAHVVEALIESDMMTRETILQHHVNVMRNNYIQRKGADKI